MNLDAVVHMYISEMRSNAQAELNWFRRQPSIESAITTAAIAIRSDGKRYSHQRRLKREDLLLAKTNLMKCSESIKQSSDFHALFSLISSVLTPIKGIGELYIYDTSLRIGANLGLLPAKIYLHAGTRVGAQKLGIDTKREAIEVSELLPEFQQLEPYEMEDVLCIFKNHFGVPDAKWDPRLCGDSWCG